MAEKQRILIAEDDALLCDILVDKFEKNGFLVTRAQNGITALELMKAEPPTLAIIDIYMPEKDGITVMQEMSGVPALKNVPVVIISNSTEPQEIERARTLGARDFIVKAVFDPGEVVDRVKDILSNPNQQMSTSAQNSAGSTITSHNQSTMPEEKNTETKAKKFVLVVEDDKFLRELLVRKLSAEGFEVENALDGEAATVILKDKTPDIILLDLILPSIDGFEVLSRVRADAKNAKVPVIIFSNLGEKADIDKAMSLGATDFMVKANFTLDEIVAKIHSIIG